jgi:K+/H+ antiporter YhaU regulatory subunit KhtT
VWNRIRVWFDNSLTRRGSLAIWTLVAIFLAIIFGSGLILLPPTLANLDAATDDFGPAAALFFDSLSASLGVEQGQTLFSTAVNLWFWFVGLMIFGTIFAWRTSALESTRNRILAGRTPLLESDHFVILGWSSTALTIIKELILSAPPRQRITVVVLVDADSRKVVEKVREMLAQERIARRARVLVRTGNRSSHDDLRRLNINRSRAVAVVEEEFSSTKFSSVAVATVLSKLLRSEKSEASLIIEASGRSAVALAEQSISGQATIVSGLDLITKVLAQSARNDAVSSALIELLNFGGAEIYISRNPASDSVSYSELILRLKGATLCGILRDGKAEVNPHPNTVVHSQDDLIVIAEDADNLGELTDALPEQGRTRVNLTAPLSESRKVAAIGRAEHIEALLVNLETFLPDSTQIHTISEEKINFSSSANQKFVIHEEKVLNLMSAELGSLVPGEIDRILLLADTEVSQDPHVIDAHTLVITELLRARRDELQATFRITSEVLSTGNKFAFEQLHSEGLDVIVGDEVSGMLIAQAMVNSQVTEVLQDLLNPSTGSALVVFNIDLQDKESTFSSVIAAGLELGVSVIGWRYFEDGRWVMSLNEAKNSQVPSQGIVQAIAVGAVR